VSIPLEKVDWYQSIMKIFALTVVEFAMIVHRQVREKYAGKERVERQIWKKHSEYEQVGEE